ncbi:MAG: bi-domain-containing oxidoreductase [Phycisphaerae bacterium]|nr:bi-domain-containing oxidoreductase [Phycisphaerae bacterium]MCZ2399625.1 bi-domain-containing oxidoreductase [Phycisphaerae bacterium]
MKQVLQHLRGGQVEVADVPCPTVRAGHLLIQTTRTLISAGTERMLVEFGRAGLIAKARSQPEKVRQVLAKIRTDGLMPTLEAVFARLDEPLPLGYCNVGRVVEVGREVEGFAPGDRVASNGPHAEMVCVPATLAARVPDGVDDDAASFTVLSSIAMHGIRLLQPGLGEGYVVVGLGLLGLVAVQLLRASGCNVLGVDVNAARCELAAGFGAATVDIGAGGDPVQAGLAFSRGRGVDGVLITASAKSDEIVHQAAQMCRKRGRIVLVGQVGLNLRRADFYEKELSFQVSCSYGPGRYDPAYEDQSRDYPLPYVRWTVARNFEAVLDSLAAGRLDVRPLISRTIPQANAAEAYDLVVKDSGVLGVVLQYPQQQPPTQRVTRLKAGPAPSAPADPVIGVIGSGNFTKLVLLPAIRSAGGRLHSVTSAGGVTALHAARKFDADEAGSDYRAVLASAEVNTVFITTRHSSHARMAAEALEAGKHVFVEKPLAIDEEGLELVRAAHEKRPDRQLMVGFNRRFAPHAVQVRRLLAARAQPVAISILVNAGDIPATHWLQDPAVGGGRLIGEGCHFVDLALFLVGHPITTVQAAMFGPQCGGVRDDKLTLTLTFADGSIATVHYWANGPKSFPKERVEVFSEGRVVVIDNWRRLQAYDWPAAGRMSRRQDKGHKDEVAQFLTRIREGGPPLIPFSEIEQVTRACFAALRSAREGAGQAISLFH